MTAPFDVNEKVCNQRSGVYAIVNIVTGKFYIGSAVKLRNRRNGHLSDLRKQEHHSMYLQRSYNKHGCDVFIFKVLEYVEDENNLLKVEQKYLDIYYPTGITYNISPIAGSNLGMKHSEETKKKISEALKGKCRTVSDEVRKKISEGNKGKIISDETRKRMSEAQKGKIMSDEAKKKISECNKGRIASDETRKRMSKAKKGMIFSDETIKKRALATKKPILQFTKNNKFIKRYEGIIEAMKETGISNISKCCLGKRRSSGGFIWKYEQQ